MPARVVAVADVYDALTHDRPYRTAMESGEALGVLHAMTGDHLDGDVVALLRE
jgi:putative two-component system response regulator